MLEKIVLASSDCTGCGVCADVCPKDCISMGYKNSIQVTPLIDEEICIKCGSCIRICPSLNRRIDIKPEQHYYMSWQKLDKERLKSTSGGVGAALISKALQDGWFVCGASMDDNLYLKHIVTNDSSVSPKFRGSKYLQSDTYHLYKQVGELVVAGNKVLFVGTPCQVEALNRFIRKDLIDNLMTCGIICHGVNSPLVWDDFKSRLEKEADSKLVSYTFRSKSHGWQKKNGGPNLRVSYEFENGRKIDVPSWKNLFHFWFGHHYILRPSCLNCFYRVESRNSDITIGDFWGIDKIFPDVDTRNGVSVAISSTKKGDCFINSCDSIILQEVDSAKAKSVLKGYIENKSIEKRIDDINTAATFEKEYLANGFDYMRRKYPAQSTFSRVVAAIKTRLHIK